jgi:uncharacterized protein (TIRG00374 family)
VNASSLKGILRWLLAIVLIVWLFRSGKLASLSDLEKLWASPALFLLAICGFALNYVLNFFRWNILLEGAGIKIKFRENIRLSMIGQFFSIFMPGAVGGDLIKAVYVSRQFPESRTKGVASILLDRVLGFLTLLLSATFFFLVGFDLHKLSHSLKVFILFLSLASGSLLLAVLLPQKAVNVLKKFKFSYFLWKRLIKTLESFAQKPQVLLRALTMSILGQAGCILGFSLIGKILFSSFPWGEMNLLKFMAGTAVGVTASAIPLSPMGLGVGQIAFGKVFLLLGAPQESYGIVIISAAQIIIFSLNLSGALWFLKSKRNPLN